MNVDEILDYCNPNIDADRVCDNCINGNIYEETETVDLYDEMFGQEPEEIEYKE